MRSGRSTRAIVGGLAALALVVATWRWIGSDVPPEAEPDLVRTAVTATTPAPSLPSALASQPESLPTSPAALDEARPASAVGAPAPTLATVGVAITLSGRVVDSARRPVADALVRHMPSPAVWAAVKRYPNSPDGPPWDELPSTRTGEDGRFRFDVRELPGATPTIRELNGGQMITISTPEVPSLIVLADGFECTRQACLGYSRGDFDVGDIVLADGLVVTGRVIDEQGQPIEGAHVGPEMGTEGPDGKREADWEIVKHAIGAATAADGRFRLERCWSGSLSFLVLAPHFVPLVERVEGLAPKPLDLGDLVLPRGDSIAGWVRDASGGPIVDARLLARSAEVPNFGSDDPRMAFEFKLVTSRSHDAETRSGPDGAFVLDTLDQPKWKIYALAPGFEVAMLADVAAGAHDVVLTLEPEAFVLVAVVDEDSGSGIGAVSAMARRNAVDGSGPFASGTKLEVLVGLEAAAAARVERDPAGLLYVGGLGESRNTLVVEAPGYATQGFELPSAAEAADAAASAGAGAAAAEGLRVRLAREATLTGRVVDDRQQPVADITLALASQDDGPVALPEQKAKSDAAGAFRFGGLRAGAWRLSVRAGGFVVPEPLELSLAKAEARDDVIVTLAGGGAITGLVLRADSSPAPGTVVDAQVPDPDRDVVMRAKDRPILPRYKTTAGVDGRFRIDGMIAGHYSVTAWPGAEAQADVQAGPPVELLLRMRLPPTVRGRVLDANGPVAGAVIDCNEYAEPLKAWMDGPTTKSSELGEYSFELSNPGAYLLRAREGGAQVPPRRVTAAWDTPVYQDLIFGGERLAGRVVDAKTGAPLPGARVSFTDESDSERDGLGANVQHFYVSTAETGDDGLFETHRLRPGMYTVSARMKGYGGAARGPLQVPRASEASGSSGADGDELLFKLSPAAILRGAVHYANGRPAEGLSVNVRMGDPGDVGGAPFENRSSIRADGGYENTDLPPGSGVAQVVRFVNDLTGAGKRWDVLAEQPVALAAGTTTTLDFELRP